MIVLHLHKLELRLTLMITGIMLKVQGGVGRFHVCVAERGWVHIIRDRTVILIIRVADFLLRVNK